MNLNNTETLVKIYTLNLNGYLDRNPQLLDAVEWNRKLFNVIVLDESNLDIQNIINRDEIFIWLKDNVGWPQACDYLRFKLISEYDYDCFIDIDILLPDTKISGCDNFISRYNSKQLNCDIIKGRSLAKILYEWFLINYKSYKSDFTLTIDLLKDINLRKDITYIPLYNIDSNNINVDFKASSIKDYLKNRPNNFCRYMKG